MALVGELAGEAIVGGESLFPEMRGAGRVIGRMAGLTDDAAILAQRIAQGKRRKQFQQDKQASAFGALGARAAGGVGKDAKALRRAVAALRGGKFAAGIPGISLLDDVVNVAMRPKAPQQSKPKLPRMKLAASDGATSAELRAQSERHFAKAKELARPFTEPVGRALSWMRANPGKSALGVGVGAGAILGLRYLDRSQNQALRVSDAQAPTSSAASAATS